MRNEREHIEQVHLFTWANSMSAQYPVLELLYAIPNGGHRHISVAKKMKAEGVKRGVPDVCLPVPNEALNSHGLYIEMKDVNGRLSEHQQEWGRRLRQMGYWVVVCYSAEEAIALLEDYVGMNSRDRLQVKNDWVDYQNATIRATPRGMAQAHV